ncbi:hypothetical protein [Nonomuraea sp. NPDC050310]|uniref:hypothetical protein n=1 Tax=Nonomuraea sp. NPDC050310 TaxID=3154935 RepID=UPI0034054BD9
MSRARLAPLFALALLLTSVAAAPPATAASADPQDHGSGKSVIRIHPDEMKLPKLKGVPDTPPQKRAAAPGQTPPVGTVRQWPALDTINGEYLKPFTLRAVGAKIEVWVANDTAYPEGDCRRAVAGDTTVTDAQVASLVQEFDGNIYPKEVAQFSTPPDRDGSGSLIPLDYSGAGDKTVTLVDNVRDDDFYDIDAPGYIAGFHYGVFNDYTDRNVMTIDAWDWKHRTGPNPPDEPTADPCTSRTAEPYQYESTFAHEWQHLLLNYADPGEAGWINEGLSDWAMTLTGYVDPRKEITERGWDGHIQCFLGWTTAAERPFECGGPENSLNLWDETTHPAAVFADYGIAYAFMHFLEDRYGKPFMKTLHTSRVTGIAGLGELIGGDPYKVIHDFQTSALLDKLLESRRSVLVGLPKSRIASPSLRMSLNLANPFVNRTPGAAPNGADFVPLQKADGTLLRGRDLRSLRFEGAKTVPVSPLAWTVVSDDPDRAGNPVLWSGDGNDINEAAITQVTLPSGTVTLSLLAKYGAEAGYDYGYVIVSTDGGATYTAVAGDKTVAGPLGPSLNGATNGFEPHTFDLSAYAGKSVLLGVQYVSDGGVNEGGLKVDDLTVNGTVISDGSSLAPFKSKTEIKPVDIKWNLRLVGLDERNHIAAVHEFRNRNPLRLGAVELLPALVFPKVIAIVSYDDATELVRDYQPYTLTVNGVVQPGGKPLL